jgi:PKD repeat protein
MPQLKKWFRITLEPGTDAAAFIQQLRRLDSVKIAEPVPLPPPPPAITPDLTQNQGYLDDAPDGIDARHSWTIAGGDGSGVTIYDIEYNWLQTHEDLSKASGVSLILDEGMSNYPPGYHECSYDCDAPCDRINREHGTAVLGELIADNDSKGVTGISYSADIGLVPSYVSVDAHPGLTFWNPGNAILLAVADGSPGDVILIEQQLPVCGLDPCTAYGPIEWDSPVFNAIETAVGAGFVVVEPAGNGGVDLDQAACNNLFDRNVRDSGAIIVGAGEPPYYGHDRERLSFSSYGSRVDVQGWGWAVMTTGYGPQDLPYAYINEDDPDNPDFWYTYQFSGTSSASPMVAGAAANLQSIAISEFGEPLTPDQIRSLLVETGSPQLGDTAENIGPRPNLREAISQLLANEPPVASFTATPRTEEPLTVDFNASASTDSDGSIVDYTWNFGDGNSGTGVTAFNTYAAAGNYTVSLTVTDDDGATDMTEQVVTVSEAQDYTCTDVGGSTSLETAFALPFLDAPINVEYCDPATWYSFSLQSGQGITVALTPHINQGDLDLILHDQYGNSIGSRYNIGNGYLLFESCWRWRCLRQLRSCNLQCLVQPWGDRQPAGFLLYLLHSKIHW